jgi:hypothetical protein
VWCLCYRQSCRVILQAVRPVGIRNQESVPETSNNASTGRCAYWKLRLLGVLPFGSAESARSAGGRCDYWAFCIKELRLLLEFEFLAFLFLDIRVLGIASLTSPSYW